MIRAKVFFFFALSLHFASAQQVEVLKEISKFSRSYPDSAIKLLPTFYSHKNDSIQGTAYLLAGNAWYFKSRYDTAMQYYGLAASIFQKRNEGASLGKAYNGLGLCYYFLSNYEMAFQYHKKALALREELKDPQITSTLNNLGLVLVELGSNTDALQYYKKSLEAKIRYKQFSTLSTTLTNIARIYRDASDYPDSAIFYDLQNLKHLDSIPDDRNLATCYNNLALSYNLVKDYEKAEVYLRRALTLEKKLERGFELLNVCLNLADVLIKRGDLNKADLYLDSAFLLVKNANDFRPIQTIYMAQARVDSLKGNRQEAYLHLLNHIEATKKFDKIEREDLVLELEKKYQAELKEQQITELQQANTIKDLEAASARQRQIFMIVGLVLLVASVVILYNRYQLKQRTAKVLDEKNSELQKLNAFKDKMFAVISHDLRNPIDAFSTLMESLNQNLQHASQEELKEYLQSMLDSAKDLKSLLNNLLEWSLVQIGKLPFNLKAFPIQDAVRASISHIDGMATSKRIKIIDCSDGELVLADKSMAIIIIRNLLSNAIKFSPEAKTIQIKSIRNDKHVVIAVQDEGIGMSPADVAKLFNQNENARNIGSSTAKGAGIGLLLCKELADKNGGKIYAESTEGKGSTFYLELPLA